MSMHAGRSRGLRSGFTLVEMLLVVSTIAMLISILLPTVSRTREITRIAICASNLRQMGTALHHYRTEYSRYGLVWYEEGTKKVIRHNDYKVLLVPYVTGFGPFVCPSTSNVVTQVDDLTLKPIDTVGNFSSYESYGAFDDNTIKTPINTRRIESRVWMMMDQDNTNINWNINAFDNHGAAGGNALLLDQHVMWVTGDDWYAKRWEAQTLRWRMW